MEVAKTFAMSKLYYVAQVLPLPNKYKKRIESNLSKFIFKGRHERLKLSDLENTPEKGGFGLPNIGVKADCLLLKQMCRMLALPGENSFNFLGYWLGSFLSDTGWGENFPELAEVGPASRVMSARFPLHQYMLDTFLEAVGREEIKETNIKTVTTKEIYAARMEDMLMPPKVEAKFPLVNYQELVYPRILNPVLEAKQKDLLFSLTHGIYRNRERLYQQNRTEDAFCPNQACRREDLVQDIEHIFCCCYKVRSAWQWIKNKIFELVSDLGPPVAVSNTDIVLAKFPTCRQEAECMFLLGTFLELVDSEVISKQKELLLDTLLGVLKSKMMCMGSRAVPQVQLFM